MSVLTKFFPDWGIRVNSKQRGRKKKVRNRNEVTNSNTPCTLPERLNRVLGGHDRRLSEIRLDRFFFLKYRLSTFFYFEKYRLNFSSFWKVGIGYFFLFFKVQIEVFFFEKVKIEFFFFFGKVLYRWDSQHADVYFLCIINMQQDWPLRSLIIYKKQGRIMENLISVSVGLNSGMLFKRI